MNKEVKKYLFKITIVISLLISFFVISASNNTTKLNALSAGNIYTNSTYTNSAYTKEELNKGVIYTDELEVINEGINYYTDKIIFDNNGNNYFILGKVVYGENSEEKRYPYVAFYQNDTLLWSAVNENYDYGEYVDGIFKENTILLYGNYGIEQKKLILSEYDFSGKLVKGTHYYNDGDSFAKKIFRKNNFYYLIGETNCKKFIYENIGENSLFIAQIDSKYEICDICFLGNDGENTYLDCLDIDDHLKVLVKVGGNGYYDYNIFNPYIIINFSFRMEVAGYEKISGGINDTSCLKSDGEKLYIFTNIDNEIRRKTYSFNLTFLLEETFYKLENNAYKLYQSICYDIKNKIWFLGLYYTTDKIYSEYVFIDNSLTILDFNKEIKKGNKVFHNYYYKYGVIYTIGINYGFGNKLTYLAKKGLIKRVNEKCYFNTILLEEEKINQENKFGYYDGLASYNYNNISFKVEGGYYVDLHINIKNNSVYDVGLVLYFNGDGNLNGKKIESGYTVLEVGNYVLEIIGNKDKKYIHFLVDDLGIKEKNTLYEQLSYTVHNDNTCNEPSIELENDIYIPKTYEFEYLYIGAGILGFILSFIKFRKKGEKYV